MVLVVPWWMLLLCVCPRSVTSREVQQLLGAAAKAHAHTAAVCGRRQWWEYWIKSSPSNSVLLPGSEDHVPSAVTNESWTALPNSWSVSCKSLKNCSSLAHPLCHILQHEVQTIPRYQVDAADQFIPVMLLCICADQIWLKPCFPLKAYEHST